MAKGGEGASQETSKQAKNPSHQQVDPLFDLAHQLMTLSKVRQHCTKNNRLPTESKET